MRTVKNKKNVKADTQTKLVDREESENENVDKNETKIMIRTIEC